MLAAAPVNRPAPLSVRPGMTRLLRLLAAAALAAFLVAACGGGDATPVAAGPGTSAPAASTGGAPTGSSPTGGAATGGAPTGTPATASITIKDFAFGDPLTVKPGTVVTVENQDAARHDAVSDDGKFRTPLLGKGEKATFTAPTEPGTYTFSCSVHSSMTGIGTLTVRT